MGGLHQRNIGTSKKLAQVARLQARGLLIIPRTSQADDESDAEFDEALAAFGLQQSEGETEDETEDAPKPEPKPEPTCYLWPCNVRAWNVWQAVQNKWRMGVAGPEDLDWVAVEVYLGTVPGFRPRARAQLWAGLRAMESAAIEVWEEKRAQQRHKQ